jgi:hypothetical protein
MPVPVIAGGVALAGKVIAGTAGRVAVGQAVKAAAGQATRQTARYGIGRTASGKTLQAAKPRKHWDWKDIAGNFEPNERN